MQNKITTTLNRQQEVNQRPRIQQILTRLRNPANFHHIRNAPRPMKKIQIDPHSRTVSIQSHGQPKIVLQSRSGRGLKLQIRGKGNQPSKVINVMFKNHQTANTQQVRKPEFTPQQIRKPEFTPQIPHPTQASSTPQNNHNNQPQGNGQSIGSSQTTQQTNTHYFLLGQNNAQNQQGVLLQTGSGTTPQIRFLGDARSTLEFLLRQKILASNTQTTPDHVTNFVQDTTNGHANTQISKMAEVTTSTPVVPNTTFFPFDYETEEPEYPNSA